MFMSRIIRTALSTSLVLALAACREAEDPNIVRLNGRIEATMVDLAPKVTGRVIEVRVRVGDKVKAGDLLVRFDLGDTALAPERDQAAVSAAEARARDLEAGSRRSEIAAAEAEVQDRRAALDLAQKELERQHFLLSRKVGTERDRDRATTELERAQASIAMSESRLRQVREGSRRWQIQQARDEIGRARAQLAQSKTIVNEAELRAPADAVVIHRLVEPGQLVSAGQTGLTLAFADRLYVRTFIPEPQLGRVKQGQAAEVIVDAFRDKRFKARVAEINTDAEFTPKAVETRAERINLVYAAKVNLDGGWTVPLVPGQPAEVTINAAQPPQ
jgi:HlyD family secretion protein